jgi:hypothetical protein
VIVVRALMNTILATMGGCMAGGAAAAATLALVSGFPDFSRAASVYSAVAATGFYLVSAIGMAFLGPVGGVMFGFIPTLLLGTLLSLLRFVPPFQYLLVWAATGAAAGLLIHLWFGFGTPTVPDSTRQGVAWATAWAVGGAASMSVYWLAFVPQRADEDRKVTLPTALR